MAERIVYAICDDSCKFETMTKEEILAAIEQALEQGYVSDPDGAVFSKIKEICANGSVQIWAGTEEQFNALNPAPEYGRSTVRVGADGVLYLCSDETLFEDIDNHISDENNPHKVTFEQVMGEDVVPIDKGGTGATTGRAAEYAICNDMGETTNAVGDDTFIVAKRVDSASESTGALTTKRASLFWTYIVGKIRSTFGFSSDGVLPISNGGTGASSAAAARNALGLGKTTGPVPVANGGTGATDKINACKNIGAAMVGQGEAIPANANLNDYTTPGTYYSVSGANSATLTNTPYSETGFKLEVMNTVSANHWIQEIKANSASARTYRRIGSKDGGWQSWYKIMQSAGDALSIGDGGTGATTDRAAEYNICNGMSESTVATSDSTLIVCKLNASASTTNGALTYKKASDVWTWIANKIKSVFPTAAVEVQMGTVNDVNSTGVSVTFPEAFSGVPVVVASGGSEASSVQVKSVTKTGFKLESPVSNNDGCQWIAVYKA